MKVLSLLKGVVVLVVVAAMLDAARASGVGQALGEAAAGDQSLARTVRLTFSDGHTRTVALEGVGCPVSICSKVAIEGHAAGETASTSIALDSVSAFDFHGPDASVQLRDGTTRQLSVVPWNRVLYLDGEAGPEKIDIAQLRLAEFLASPREHHRISQRLTTN